MKQSAVRARIRQICCLGLPGPMLMASLLPALREVVPSDSAGFFWVDSTGDMKNLFAERLLPPDAMALYFERYYDSREASFRRAFRERASAPDGVVATSADGELEQTGYYHEILRRLDAHHVLYGIAYENGNPLGQVSLYRGADAPAFSPQERADLASVMRYVSHGIAVDESASGAERLGAFHHSGEEAMLVTDRAGHVRHASEKARRLLLLATTSQINAASLRAAVNESAARVLATLAGRLDAAARGEEGVEPPSLTIDTQWGRFGLRACWLDDDWQSSTALVGISIHREEPVLLRFVQALGRVPISIQQREIALLIAQGRSNQEIADGLGVSLNTVNYHVKQLFMKLDVHDRAEAVARITAGVN